jgi:hypothetical protein
MKKKERFVVARGVCKGYIYSCVLRVIRGAIKRRKSLLAQIPMEETGHCGRGGKCERRRRQKREMYKKSFSSCTEVMKRQVN